MRQCIREKAINWCWYFPDCWSIFPHGPHGVFGNLGWVILKFVPFEEIGDDLDGLATKE
jgi:hypothetical protein